MGLSERWLLPDGVDELLPPEAWAVEHLRRQVIDNFARFGYELVAPPLIEYLESLYTGTGNDLDLKTFKVTDQLTGRMMGVRADITPQVARIDAHLLKKTGVSRLCYSDTVLHTRPAHMLTNRSPFQTGCELFGETSSNADIEIISLMIETLRVAGIQDLHIDLAHVGIYRGLVNCAAISDQEEALVFDALRRKSIPELDEMAQSNAVVSVIRDIATLSGGVEALTAIKPSISALNASESDLEPVLQAIDALAGIAAELASRYPKVELSVDFCELRGYNYHTGVMFAAYTPGYGYALAQGGRYDDIGGDFGNPRPATGFSTDLKTLSRVVNQPEGMAESIFAPQGNDQDLLETIALLRQSKRVIQALNADETAESMGCTKQLVNDAGSWVVADC